MLQVWLVYVMMAQVKWGWSREDARPGGPMVGGDVTIGQHVWLTRNGQRMFIRGLRCGRYQW